jgi:predicted house-cleaning noncanonical NTP pyrophosphatase (MazG superfamily)
VPAQFSLGENLPWFTATAEQNITETRSHLLKSIVISNVGDLKRLHNIAPNSVKVILTPSGEDIRSDAFIDAVGEVCRERNLPVEIQGSILSHAYHQLARAGVHVFCAEPGKTQPELRQRKSFDKLVRDQIPQHIESRGESVTSARIDTEELERALIAKLLEETTEFLTAKPGPAKSEELADMLEVLRGLAGTAKVLFSEVEARANKKRAKRGGFDLGVVLRSTNLAFEDESDVLFSEIKQDTRARVRLSDLSERVKHSNKATLPTDRLLSNEVVRRTLEHGQQSATIRAEMEAGNVVLTLEHVVDLAADDQINLIEPDA